ASKRYCALRRFLNLFRMLCKRTVFAEFPPKDLAVPDDHTQEIVEIVRNASGETPDGLHLRRHAQLPLEDAPFGDVLGKYFELRIVLAQQPSAASNRDERIVFPLPFGLYIAKLALASEQLDQ